MNYMWFLYHKQILQVASIDVFFTLALDLPHQTEEEVSFVFVAFEDDEKGLEAFGLHAEVGDNLVYEVGLCIFLGVFIDIMIQHQIFIENLLAVIRRNSKFSGGGRSGQVGAGQNCWSLLLLGWKRSWLVKRLMACVKAGSKSLAVGDMRCISSGEASAESKECLIALYHRHYVIWVLLHDCILSFVIGIKWMAQCENLS